MPRRVDRIDTLRVIQAFGLESARAFRVELGRVRVSDDVPADAVADDGHRLH